MRPRPAGSPAAPAGRPRHPRRRRRPRRRPDPARIRLDDRQDRGLGPGSGRGAAPAATGLRETTAVVEGGTTNRASCSPSLDRPEVRAGDFDNPWLDRLTARRPTFRPRSGGPAGSRRRVGADLDEAARTGGLPRPRGAGRRRVCGRGGPPMPAALPGPTVRPARLSHRRRHIRVTSGVGTADVTSSTATDTSGGVVVRRPAAPCRLGRGGRHAANRRRRRCACGVPGSTAALCAAPDRRSSCRSWWNPETGSPKATRLTIIESMKMENTITAPFAGTIAAVETAANVQVEAGAPLRARRDLRTPIRASRPAPLTSPGWSLPTLRHSSHRADIRGAAQLPARLRLGPRLGADDADPAAPAQRVGCASRHRSAAVRGPPAGSVRRRQLAVPAAR